MSRSRLQQRLLSLAIILAILLGGLPRGVQTAQAISPNIVISQVYGGGGNTGATFTHDFVELFNRGTTTVSVSGWSIQYASATGTGNLGAVAGQLTELPNVSLAPGQYLLVQEAQGAGGTTPLPAPDVTDASPINMSGTGGKVALVNTTTPLGCNGGSTACSPAALATIVDLVGWDGANFYEGSAPAPATTNSTAVLRGSNGCTDTDNNGADFTAGAPTPRNSASPLNPCGGPPPNQPVVASCGTALLAAQGYTASTSITARDGDGIVTDIAITAISPDPAPGSVTLSGLVPASSVGGTASATVNVDAAVPPGSYSVTVTATNNDASPQTGTCTLSVSVQVIKTIGEVQGVVNDADDGTLVRSPFAPASGNGTGQTVLVQGVIYQKTLARTSAGGSQNGFFIQNTAATADGNPNTSDGIFVFMGGFTSLIDGYTPQVGDEIVLQGRVSEFFFLTELSSGQALAVVRSGANIDAETPAFETDPPSDLAEANRYWERREGMRAQVPAGSVVLNGRNVFPSTADGEVWVAHPSSEIAQRSDPYTRRAFRDPHPLDDIPDQLFDNGNGYRILMGSLGIKATAGDNTVLIAPARTFDALTNAPVGGVYFSFEKYSVQVGQQIELASGVDPSLNSPPDAADRSVEYNIVTFNLENLYDYRDDPFDGCDFTGNTGCPGVSPPFDYVPSSDAVYQARLQDIARQVIDNLHSPDIILAQEAEDQDICTASGAVLTCGATDNADGRPDTLQELATVIAGLGGPAYQAAYDRDGSDDRGIVAGFLYRADRVELLPASASDPVLGSSPQVVYRGTALDYNIQVQNPKALNAVLPADVDRSTGVDGPNVFTRDPQVGLFRIWRTGIGASVWVDVYALSNHFSSTPDARVGQRTEQAAYNAAIVSALLAANSGARVTVGGDLNVYPRPDDPFYPESDQLGPLYDQAGMTNLWDVLVADVPASAYSYVFEGQAQTLDQMFVTPSLLDDLVQMRAAHINSDWPADYGGDVARGTSDHDPQAARYALTVTLDRLEALLTYFNNRGDITGNNTFRNLMDRLAKARRYYNNGQMDAYRQQLAAFSSQVRDLTPRFITQAASNALVQEADFLRSLP